MRFGYEIVIRGAIIVLVLKSKGDSVVQLSDDHDVSFRSVNVLCFYER